MFFPLFFLLGKIRNTLFVMWIVATQVLPFSLNPPDISNSKVIQTHHWAKEQVKDLNIMNRSIIYSWFQFDPKRRERISNNYRYHKEPVDPF